MFGYKSKKQLIEEGYTHYGGLWGIPCYIGDIESEAPLIATANFIPQWVLDIADWVIFTMYGLINMNNPDAEPLPFKIAIKGPIKDK
ncbi:hypothetical protein C8D76_103119 [Pasteurella langaaensis DSM 22999]|uniref:Uncharacterized protein n=1 Tax=Alitibacter langaaensis DSM 22999 TaxID=1122935 RepID=A0A2U0TAB2_9PAST|nr:hypothetical protein [Pasteurella langaaensis]PVX40546.1 hypothetical protein C8D76_103119 [Pasteurella langaaensis DSM 22999]